MGRFVVVVVAMMLAWLGMSPAGRLQLTEAMDAGTLVQLSQLRFQNIQLALLLRHQDANSVVVQTNSRWCQGCIIPGSQH